MKLNRLESKFFDDILKTDLDVPVHASLEYSGKTLDIIVVPEINDQGHFLLKYFNASPYEPEPDDSGVATLSNKYLFWIASIVGPSMERSRFCYGATENSTAFASTTIQCRTTTIEC